MHDWSYIKWAVAKRDGLRCALCQITTPPFDYDHIQPLSDGGAFGMSNVRILCRPCHHRITAEWKATKRGRGYGVSKTLAYES